MSDQGALNDILDALGPASAALRRQAIRAWLDSLPDFDPCPHCGRVVLAGRCCARCPPLTVVAHVRRSGSITRWLVRPYVDVVRERRARMGAAEDWLARWGVVPVSGSSRGK